MPKSEKGPQVAAPRKQSRQRRQIGLVLLASACLIAAGPSQQASPAEEGDFWRSLADPGRKAHLAALARGKDILQGASKLHSAHLRRKALEDALAALREAVSASPQRAEGHFWVGITLYELERLRPAIQALLQVRRLDPKFGQDYPISFKLGIAYSKLGELEKAVREYDRAERALRDGSYEASEARGARATLQGNAAESLMALGRLDEAIQRYREALALQPDYALAWWGLAAALDRDEQVSKSLEAMARVLEHDPQLKLLTGDEVFFVPAGDLHYYLALGQLARGELEQARQSWQAFLAAVPDSPWALRARAHLAQLGEELESKAGARRLAPVPAAAPPPASTQADQLELRRRLQSQLGPVQSCYRQALERNPTLAGRLQLQITVSGAGQLTAVVPRASTLGSAALQRCVIGKIKQLRVARPPGRRPLTLSLPLEFKLRR